MNIVLMRRRKKKLQEVPVDTDNENDDPEWTPTEYGAPDVVLEGLVDRVCLESAVAKLPPGYRQVFELHDVLGCQHHEIAEIMGYSVGNSKSQLHKARLRLRKLLGRSLRPRRRKATAVKAEELGEAVLA